MKPELKKIYTQTLKDFGHLTDDELMGLTIGAESRGEPLDGKIAVGTVILCRVVHRKWDGQNVREVCLWPFQFSCYNFDDKQRPKMVKIAEDFDAALTCYKCLKDCHTVAHGLLKGIIRKDADIWKAKACQYLTTEAKARVDWWKKMKFVKQIGNHHFYTDMI